jgi:hypothetical protein
MKAAKFQMNLSPKEGRIKRVASEQNNNLNTVRYSGLWQNYK